MSFIGAGPLGNFVLGDTVTCYIHTRDGDYNPVTITGLAIQSFQDANATGESTGITVTTDAPSLGTHRVDIDTTGWNANATYSLLVTAGTFDSKAAAGLQVAQLRIGVPDFASIADFYAYVVNQPSATEDPAEAPTYRDLLAELYALAINQRTRTAAEWVLRNYGNTGDLRRATISKVPGTSITRERIAKGQ